MVQRTGTRAARESAVPDPASGWSKGLKIATGGQGVVAHAGVVLPRLLEPKALRFRLLAVPARLVRHARQRILKLPDDWAWAPDLVNAWTRLEALHPS